MKINSILIIILISIISISNISYALVLTPQKVVDQMMSKALKVEEVNLEAKKTAFDVAMAKAKFDVNFNSSFNYQKSKAENISGLTNPEDKTLSFGAQFNKKNAFGTTFALKYDRVGQESRLSSLSSTYRNENLVYHAMTASLKQELLQNSFGAVDRFDVRIAKHKDKISQYQRLENLENLVLEALSLFWQAFTAKENLKESIKAREKYLQLVSTVKKKSRLGYVKPGELARVKAEYAQQDQNVKQASYRYLKALDDLFDHIQFKTKEDIEFSVPTMLPSLPQKTAFNVETSRAVLMAKILHETNTIQREAVEFGSLPELNLVAKTSFTGLENSSDKALSELAGGNHPSYFVGLEFTKPFASKKIAGTKVEAIRMHNLSYNNLKQTKLLLGNLERNTYREVSTSYAIAKSSSETVKLREQVVRDEEKGYNQGRVDISELIRAYNELFQARFLKVEALGAYHVALDTLAAVKDELINEKNGH